jgi:uncharacterized protein
MHLAYDRKGPGPIDAYGGGIFRIGRTAHRGSVLLLPDGLRPWRIADVRQISFDALRPLYREARGFDILVFGTGATLDMPPRPVLDALHRAGIRVEAMPTAAACRTYNALLEEGRAVAAALIAVH